MPDPEWHRAGVTPARRNTIRRVATVSPALQRTIAVGRNAGADEQLVSGFRSIPGVGGWTVAEIVQRSHGDPDAEMMRRLEPYRGHRQRVVRYIESSGVETPRFGARITIEDHRDR